MTPRKKIVRRTPDLRRLAQAAYNDAASIATSLDLLFATEKETALDPDTQAVIVSGIRSKCLTACATLQHIEQLLGGAQ
jgi:hypothetical protein